MKKYLVIIQDEWNNLYYIGQYKKLSDSVKDINNFLDVYDVNISTSDLKEYTSTFGSCFDLDVSSLHEDRDDLNGIMIRGFVL